MLLMIGFAMTPKSYVDHFDVTTSHTGFLGFVPGALLCYIPQHSARNSSSPSEPRADRLIRSDHKLLSQEHPLHTSLSPAAYL